MEMTLLSPAKVNLGLKVLAQRPDGYHEIQTLYQMIDLSDRLTLELRPRGVELVCDHPALSTPSENLVCRAAHLLAGQGKVTAGARITLKKRIPLGAGLGGGSGNAAAVLWGLNRLWGVGLDPWALQELAGKLGSDVPFFLFAPRAYATGRGELLEKLPSSHKLWLVLLYPNFSISTPWAYAAYDRFHHATSPRIDPEDRERLDLREGLPQLEVTSPRMDPEDRERPQRVEGSSLEGEGKMAILRALLESGKEVEVGPHLWNDLEAPVGAAHPAILEMKRALRSQGATGALMSGSGSTVFGLFPSRQEAEAAQRALSQERHWSCLLAGTIMDLGEIYSTSRQGLYLESYRNFHF